jgi:hypothetical protein
MNSTIILRGHTEVSKTRKQRRAKKRATRNHPPKQPPKWPPFAIVFDCETRTGELQSLTFGFFRLLRNVCGSYSEVREEGIFYDPEEVTPSEVRALKHYSARNWAEISKDVPPHKVLLLTKQEFIKQFLFPHAEAGSLIVGFNLPFDLTRLASGARAATRVDKDWSLIFRNEWSIPDILEKDEFRIKIDRKDGKIAFFALSGSFVHKGRFASSGRFLDLFALAWALTNTSYTLKGLANDLRKRGYKVPRKLEHEPSGRVTPAEIAYCQQDVRVTVGILNALRRDFDCHRDINLNPDNAMSPASIFKAYLLGMGITLPSQKFRLPAKIQGIAAQAYYGGRSEVRIRLADVPVVHTDFLSEYPTVIINMGLWPFLIARRLRIKPATLEVKALLDKILSNPDSVFEPDLWKTFAGYALVEPHNDILPIRTDYNENSDESNIGVNILERADYPIWFAIPDLVASVLLAGKIPKIVKAIRIVPEGIQKGLRPIALRGKEKVDPVTGNIFKSIIEAKEREKKKDKDQAYFLKIMANSGYGIFIETTPKRISEAVRVRVFSGTRRFNTKSKIVEDKGKFYCPVISSLITAGGRLFLAILEREVRDAGGVYLFCDTDSMAIVAEKKSRLVRLSDPEAEKQQKVKALSWGEVETIIAKLERLNPYSFPGLLKIEHGSLTRQIYGFGVSAKRYCLFDGNYGIVHASSHGLGHLYVPKSKWIKKLEVREWVKEAWERIIKGDPHAKPLSWFPHPAMMRVGMTTPKVQIWKVIEKQQVGLPYRDQFKPRNFALSPIIDKVGDENHQDGFPKGVKRKDFMLITPFNSNSNNWYGFRYTNVHDGRKFTLAPIKRKKDSGASPQTLEHVVRMHTTHPESKSLAPDGNPCNFLTRGLLQRAPITANGKSRIIGKETDRKWEQEEDPSIFEPTLVEYRENETARITSDAKLQNEIRNCRFSVRELAKRIKLNPSTIQNASNGRRIRKSSASKIWHFLKKR